MALRASSSSNLAGALYLLRLRASGEKLPIITRSRAIFLHRAFLKDNADHPFFAASNASTSIRTAVFGAPTEYMYLDEGLDAVGKIGNPELLSFFRGSYQPRGAVLLLVGNLEAEPALDLAEAWFGDWRARGARLAPKPAPAPPPGGSTLVLSNPHVRVARVEAWCRLPDGGATARVFASSLERRSWSELRDCQGLTYGVTAGLVEQGSMVALRWSTQVTRDWVDVVKEQFAAELRAPLDAVSVDEGKRRVALDQRSAWMDLLGATHELSEIYLRGGTLESVVDAALDAVSPEQVRDLAAHCADHLRYVVVMPGE